MDKPIPVFNYGGQPGDYVPGGSAKSRLGSGR